MNPPPPGLPTQSFNNMMSGPIWYPPLSVQWIVTIFIVFVGAVSNRLAPRIRRVVVSPIGFFGLSVCAIGLYSKFPPITFALLFFLLSVWSAQSTSHGNEGFLNAANVVPEVDWVTNSKRWYVEKVLKERPLGIQEKGVATYPVQGASAQAGTSAGNT